MTSQIRRNVIYNMYMFAPTRLKKMDDAKEETNGNGNGNAKSNAKATKKEKASAKA